MRKWAVEGLSYLTLDAEVKEKLIEDSAALTALIEVAKVHFLSFLPSFFPFFFLSFCLSLRPSLIFH